MGKRKAIYRPRVQQSSCMKKETVDIDIFSTSRNGDRKIMQSIRITSRPPLNISLGYIKCYSSSNPRDVKSHSYYIRYNSKMCS